MNSTKFRENIVNDRFNSVPHNECYKSYTQFLITPVESLQKHLRDYANHIGKSMIHLYGSAKKLSISAHTFPARVVMGSAAEKFNFNNFNSKCGESKYNLQYITPTSYREILEITVEFFR